MHNLLRSAKLFVKGAMIRSGNFKIHTPAQELTTRFSSADRVWTASCVQASTVAFYSVASDTCPPLVGLLVADAASSCDLII